MKYVYMPVFDSSKEIQWTKELLHILEAVYPANASVHIIDRSTMIAKAKGAKRLCFRHLVFYYSLSFYYRQ